MTDTNDTPTRPDPERLARTAAATAAVKRRAEERRAAYLRERGWTCTPPAGQVEPHPWQEYSAAGYTCHFPGCTTPIPEHPDRAGS